MEPKVIEGLTEGRMVHYVLDPADGVKASVVGEHRPAVVVRVWDHVAGTSNLQVFLDSDAEGELNDGAGPLLWATSRMHSEGKEIGTWHWIEEA